LIISLLNLIIGFVFCIFKNTLAQSDYDLLLEHKHSDNNQKKRGKISAGLIFNILLFQFNSFFYQLVSSLAGTQIIHRIAILLFYFNSEVIFNPIIITHYSETSLFLD